MRQIKLNEDQLNAVEAIADFLKSGKGEYFFLLNGAAGTGKTTTMKEVVKRVNQRLVFTAPTNKATKVLKEVFDSIDLSDDEGYYPETCTIYSLLGLRIQPNGAVKELTVPDTDIDLKRYKAVVVDEASMINAELWKYIKRTAEKQKIKFIFLGDDCQLPPVKEVRSQIWDAIAPITLEKVMRHDNQILTLAQSLRKTMNHPAPSITLESNHAGEEGVWRLSAKEFTNTIRQAARASDFSAINQTKAIAWRNVTVDGLNNLIRGSIFDDAPEHFIPGDRVIVTEPAADLNTRKTFATTDSEGTVVSTKFDWHPLYPHFKTWVVTVAMDAGGQAIFTTLHPDSTFDFTLHLNTLTAEAKATPRKWREFWGFKESFHHLRFGYALTAHRSQGSTYETVFVDAMDILRNMNRAEGFRCLYVACTRARKQLYIL